MSERQSLYPVFSYGLPYGLADQPILIDGMKLEFDEKVALYPAAVEVTQDDAGGSQIRRQSSTQ